MSEIIKEKKKRKLTMKQEKFAQEYARTGNGTKSAMVAYGCSYESAHTIAVENLRKLSVEERIKTLSRAIADSALELLSTSNALQKCIAQAISVIEDPEANAMAIAQARTFLLQAHKQLAPDEPKETHHKHAHVLFPKREG